MNKYLLCLTCSVVALTSSHLAVASPLDTSHIHTQHTLGLKPISSLEDSYNLAAAVFLPDAQDGFGFASNTLDNKYETSSGNCAGFALSSCPAHAKCSKCSFDTKYKFTSCDTNYKQSGNACIAKTCSEINGGYKADVPTNQICNITNTSVRTCYSSCRTVNTSGYPLDTCPSGAKCTTAPDCVTSATTKGNCSPVKQKVTGCTSSTQKVNSTATACIDKDDTCPTNYYKSCATGTQGDPKYTERGSACYQCKVVNANIADILYSDLTTSSQVLNDKTAIGVVFDTTNKLALGLNFKIDNWSKINSNFGVAPFSDIVDSSYIARNDTAGKTNTATIVANGGSKATAAYYCYNYTTAGTKAHDWFLPSGSQVKSIQKNYYAINNSLNALGISSLPYSYWSSTSCHETGAFHINGTSGHGCGETGNAGKTDGYRYIIPVIQYAE